MHCRLNNVEETSDLKQLLVQGATEELFHLVYFKLVYCTLAKGLYAINSRIIDESDNPQVVYCACRLDPVPPCLKLV